MKFIFHPEAAGDLFNAMDYYEEIQEGLGLQFHTQVSSTIANICSFPKACPPFKFGSRRAVLRQFPFALVYRQRNSEIEIAGIMHTRQDPKNILKRLP